MRNGIALVVSCIGQMHTTHQAGRIDDPQFFAQSLLRALVLPRLSRWPRISETEEPEFVRAGEAGGC